MLSIFLHTGLDASLADLLALDGQAPNDAQPLLPTSRG